MPDFAFTDGPFKGLDQYHDPKYIPQGYSAQLDNLDVEGGQLIVRPGKQGQLASAMPGPICCQTPIVQDDTTTWLWFACGSKIYYFVPDGAHTSATAIALPGATALSSSITLNTVGTSYTVSLSANTGLGTGGTLYITDGTNWIIGTITAGGNTTTLTVVSTSQSATSGTLSHTGSSVNINLTAASVRIHQSAGYVYISDNSTYFLGTGNSGLLRFLPDGTGGQNVFAMTIPPAPTAALSNIPLLPNPGEKAWKTNDITAQRQTTLTSTVTLSSIGSNYTVAVAAGTLFTNGYTVYVTDGTNWLIGLITSGGGTSSLTVKTGAQSATSGTIATSGSSVTIEGQALIPTVVGTPKGSRAAPENLGYNDSAFWQSSTSSMGVGETYGLYGTTFGDTGATCLGFNATGLYLTMKNPIALLPCLNANAGSMTSGPLYQATPEVFYVSFLGETDNAQPASRLQVTFSVYSDNAGVDLLESQSVYIGLMTKTTTLQQMTFDFRGVGAIGSVQMVITNANANISGTNANPLIADIQINTGGFAFGVPSIAVPLNPLALSVLQGDVYASPVGNACTGGGQATVVAVPQATAFFTANQSFWTDVSASPDYSQVQTLSASIDLNYNIGSNNTVLIRMFIVDSSGNYLYGQDTYVASGVLTPLFFDITTGVAAGLTMTAIQYMGIQFRSDIPITTAPTASWPTSGNTLLMTLYSITEPGNLTVGTSISYNFIEIEAETDLLALLNVIQSDGSALSNAILISQTTAEAIVTLPARANPLAMYLAVYRFGDFVDTFGRLVCWLPYSTFNSSGVAQNTAPSNFVAPNGTVFPAPPIPAQTFPAAPANPYVSCTFPGTVGEAGIQLTDNTPSSWLYTAQNYVGGRISPPPNVRDITDFEGRLCLLAGTSNRSELWMSWLLSNDTNAGLYFSSSVDPTDPNAPIMGFYDHVGTEDNDAALRLIPNQDRLIILFSRKPPYILIGDDPSEYAIHPFPTQSSALGLAARDAVMMYGTSLVYLTVNGLVAWNTWLVYGREHDTAPPYSLPIRALLNPSISYLRTPAMNPAAYALCALWTHGNCIYLAAPGVYTDTSNQVIYRYDPNSVNPEAAPGIDVVGAAPDNPQDKDVGGGWSRWNQGNVTGGCALVGQDDSNGHFVAGLDGMIYEYVVSEGDKATSSASQTGIAWAYSSRMFGNDETDLKYAQKRPYRWDGLFESTSSEPSEVAVVATINTWPGLAVWTTTWTLQQIAGPQHISLRAGPVSGLNLNITLSGTSFTRFVIAPQRIQGTTGSERR